MLPFSRIIQYGNIAPAPGHIIKVQGSKFNQSNTIFLTSTGNLWAIGSNNSGMFGTGSSTALTQWTLIATNVKNFWCDSISSPGGVLLYITNDNKWFSSGIATALGINASSVMVFTDRTNIFGAVTYDNIKYLQLTYENINIVMKDGSMYTGGANGDGRLGLGNTNFGTFALRTDIGSVIQKARFNTTGTFYILRTDGTLAGSGNSTVFQLNPNVTRSTFINLNTEVLDFYVGTNNYFTKKIDGIYVAGTNNSGQNGNGSTAGTVTVPTLVTSIGNPDYIYSAYNSAVAYYNSTGEFKYWGDNTQGKIGTGSTSSYNVPTLHDKVLLPEFSHDETIYNDGWFINSSNSYILGTDNMIYVAGAIGTHTPGIGSNSYRFKPITLPLSI
ncbi:regulator of chromosome condensation [Cronobacter phage vB_CsaM_GAP32]|uniref:DNA condensation protein n=1 Tax=Cronobacter phage vB_CsaM_GAP32 TaxID=1141136 RepID=K4F6B8_9CAUD|nr:regulator of chromosome condensation [Cronobacter phage vB_CsaM_GAP32]AFC21448.1 hypothetical protein GAP32_001 [Cronobacter phage vB_CsaM_GAP32]